MTFRPSTTLAAETGNNTIASAAFAAQGNGNAAGSLPVRNLLYSGATTNIFAHLEVWFGGSRRHSQWATRRSGLRGRTSPV